jgi:hypothetical protein
MLAHLAERLLFEAKVLPRSPSKSWSTKNRDFAFTSCPGPRNGAARSRSQSLPKGGAAVKCNPAAAGVGAKFANASTQVRSTSPERCRTDAYSRRASTLGC